MKLHPACRVVLVVTFVIEKDVDQQVKHVLMFKKQQIGVFRFLHISNENTCRMVYSQEMLITYRAMGESRSYTNVIFRNS